MADPKYAGLPGIVYDQPDVYETSDLPESDQHDYSDIMESSDAVEILHISPSQAHSKFADKILCASRVDFSDRISHGPRTGYQARRIEWDVAGGDRGEGGDGETLVQRYNRLMCEVTDLQEQLLQHVNQDGEELAFDSVTGAVPATDSSTTVPTSTAPAPTVSAVQLERQVEGLHSQLLGLQLETKLGADLAENIANPHLATHRHLSALISSLQQVKSKPNTTTTSSKSPAVVTAPSGGLLGPDGAVTYQLFYSPEMAKLNQLGPALRLEQRLDRLEKLLGNDQDKLSRLWSWTREGSVLGAVTWLGQRMALLDPPQLDLIEGRLHALHTKMNAVAERAAAGTGGGGGGITPEREAKLQELQEVVQKCDILCSALPEVVERLVALQGLHQEASQFGRTLQQLDVAQTQLQASLASNDTLLNAVNDRFADNLASVNANIAALDTRIQALDKPATGRK